MNASQTAAPYQNRSTGLIVFGALTIFFGLLAGLISLVVVAASLRMADPSRILPAFFLFLLVSASAIWLGIGSILMKRWARALMVISSWMLLIGATVSQIQRAFFAPEAGTHVRSLAYMEGQTAGAIVAAIVLIGAPIVWIIFYSRRDVRLTCEWRNPKPSWTDACPLPVLA